MLEGFQTIKIKNVAKGTPKVTLDKGRLVINNPALRIINKDVYFDVGVNVKAKQICLVGSKVKKPQSLSGARKGVKTIANQEFIGLISKFVKGYDENKRFNIPIEVVENALVLSIAEAEVIE